MFSYADERHHELAETHNILVEDIKQLNSAPKFGTILNVKYNEKLDNCLVQLQMINSDKSYYVKIDNAKEIMENNSLEIGKTICAIKVKEVEKPIIETRGVYDCVTQNGDIATRAMLAHNEQLQKELKEQQQVMIEKQKTELANVMKK